MPTLLLTHPAVQQFISENEKADTAALMLRASKFPEIPMAEAVEQIKSRAKAAKKLPEWYATPGLIFPPSLSMEQCSSEATAKFKANLVSGNTLADLTGGFGVDCYYLSKNFEQTFYVEQNQKLTQLASHNFKLLGAKTIAAEHKTATDFLKNISGKLSCIYLDPARRDANQQKVFRLQDCEPNVVALLPGLLQKADRVLVKTAPVMDIDLAIAELKLVEKVWVISHNSECREVLYLLSENGNQNPEITAVDLQPTAGLVFSFYRADEKTAEAPLSAPLNFIYEPNPSVLKAGAFKSICDAYQVKKLHTSSHLYTSQNLRPHFPGRIFNLQHVARLNKKELRKLIPTGKANITTRNFPDSVDGIRKKSGLKEGGDTYIFGTTDLDNKPVLLICNKVISEK